MNNNTKDLNSFDKNPLYDFKKNNPHICYLNQDLANQVAFESLHWSLMVFMELEIVKNPNKFLDILKENKKKHDTKNNIINISPEVESFGMKIFMYKVFSMICIENYYKAKLLNKGYIIHEIVKEKDMDLFDKQKSEPLKVKDADLGLEKNMEYYKSEKLKSNNLKYYILKKDNYRKEYNLPQEQEQKQGLEKIIEKFHKIRNDIHLLQGISKIGLFFNEFNIVNSFFNSEIIPFHNHLWESIKSIIINEPSNTVIPSLNQPIDPSLKLFDKNHEYLKRNHIDC